MSKFDQQMREVEHSLAKLTGNKAQAAGFRKGLEKKIQQAAVKALPNTKGPY
jgi:phage shock protein A